MSYKSIRQHRCCDEIDDQITRSANDLRSFLLIPMSIGFVLLFFISFRLSNSDKGNLPAGFVYVKDFIEDIQISLRYGSSENFLGQTVRGYRCNVSILTEAATLALRKAQALAKERGFQLLIYDTYRPQKSVDQFLNWSLDETDPQTKKQFYYPRIAKNRTFELGYIAKRSGHTRGSTVDLTLIRIGQQVKNTIEPKQRFLVDYSLIYYLDDGSLDMGSSFDLFDPASHTNSTLVNEIHRQNRFLLRDIMTSAYFTNYENEWWHYTLVDEPFPQTYFDFDIK